MSNNSNEEGEDRLNILTGGHKRTAYALELELIHLAKKHGIENLGFLTLTIGGKTPPTVQDVSKRFNSLRTGVLKDRYRQSVWIVERGAKHGRLHMHGVVVLWKDIRTGFDFAAAEKGVYGSANAVLKGEWAFWRETAPKYGFGRTELLPVKSNENGIARYLGKYVGKHIGQRLASDKGARMIRYVGFGPGDRKASSQFAWANEQAWLWRRKAEEWAKCNGFASVEEIASKSAAGKRWAYAYRDQILAQRLPQNLTWPSLELWSRNNDAEAKRESSRWKVFSEHQLKGTAQRSLLVDSKRRFAPETPEQEKRRVMRECADEFESDLITVATCAEQLPGPAAERWMNERAEYERTPF